MSNDRQSGFPRWHSAVLRLAAVYSVAWGCFAVLFPATMFRLIGMDPAPNYPELWQCIGMMMGVYGIAYWIAAKDPVRHWPVVVAGMLGKVLGPIGFGQAILAERLPPTMGLTILTNDVIWWIPFTLILWNARVQNAAMNPVERIVEDHFPQPRLRRHSTTTPVVLTAVKSSQE